MGAAQTRAARLLGSFALCALVAIAVVAPAGASGRAPSAPAGVETGSSADSLSVSWRASNGAVRYRITLDGAVRVTTAAARVTIDDLACGRRYRVGISAVDATGNSSTETTANVSTSACRLVSPLEPQGLVVTATTAQTVSVDWQPAPLTAHVVGYLLFRNGTLVGVALRSAATFSGLACGTAYTFGVEAVDIRGLRSTRAEVGATTDACPDLTPPSMPTGLTATSTKTSVSLSWNAATDNVGVTGYVVDRDGVDLGPAAGTSFVVDGLACGTQYRFGVRAEDAARNLSPRAELEVATSPCLSTLSISPAGSDYAWTHLAATWDGTTVSLYVNGVLAATQAASGPIDQSDGPLRIGGNSIWGEWFSGRIDDVRVYDRALSPLDVQADMRTPVQATTTAASAALGLVASYSFDGSTVDESGMGNDASLAGAVESAIGKDGGSLYFDGKDDFATVPDSASLELAGGMTLEAWVQPETLAGSWRTVLIKEGAGRLAYALYGNNTDTGAPSAHVYTGSDTWARGGVIAQNACDDPALPCQSFGHAYDVAQPGQVVEAQAGAYGAQDLRYDAAKTSDHVVFRPAPGATVTVDRIVLGPSTDVRGASHVTFENLTVNGDVSIIGCGADAGQECQPDASSGGDDLTFRNVRVRATHVLADGTVVGSAGFFCAGCSHVSVLDSVIGPDTYGSPCTGDQHPEVQNPYDASLPGSRKLRRSHDLVFDGTTFQNFSQCASGQHTECLQVEPADNVTISNSVFRRCDTITVNFANDLAGASLSPAGAAAPDNVLIENSFFDTAMSRVGEDTFYALNIRECTNCTVRYNSWTEAPRLPDTGVSVNNLFLANVGPFNQDKCTLPGVTFAYNVWVGAQCAASDKNVVDPGFVDAANVDLHLAAGSPAIDAGDPTRYPARDIDRDARPRGSAPDAGADER